MTKKKKLGRKKRLQAEKMREGKYFGIFLAAIGVIAITISGIFVYPLLKPSPNQTNKSPNQTHQSNKIKAVIVDQLGYTDVMSNKSFVDNATEILQQGGYEVDLVEGKRVTVNFYRELGIHDYRLIILRCHSVLGENKTPPLALFTSEPYSSYRYQHEQEDNRTTKVWFLSDVFQDNTKYFGVTYRFFNYSMYGDFNNATIIMMGCDGFRYVGYDFYGNKYYYGDMAMAFIERGAKVYISWTGGVLGSHTDTATITLLQYLVKERQTVREAVVNTNKEVYWDPIYGSILQYYPFDVGNYTIPEIKKYDPG